MFEKLTQFLVTLLSVCEMILHDSVRRVTIGNGLRFILPGHLSLGVILLLWEAIALLPEISLLMFEIQFDLLFHIWHGRER